MNQAHLRPIFYKLHQSNYTALYYQTDIYLRTMLFSLKYSGLPVVAGHLYNYGSNMLLCVFSVKEPVIRDDHHYYPLKTFHDYVSFSDILKSD